MTWRRARWADLPIALLWAFGSGVALASLPMLPLAARLVPPCALHTLTGVPCFACGSTRAALALAHGEWWHALALNPLATAGMVLGVAGGFAAPGWVTMRGPLPMLAEDSSKGWRAGAWILVAVQWIYLVVAGR